MDELKEAIIAWSEEEFMGAEGQGPDFADLEHVSLVYTQSLDGEHDFQWEANLIQLTMTLYVDGEPYSFTNFSSPDKMALEFLCLYSGRLIAIADELWKERNE